MAISDIRDLKKQLAELEKSGGAAAKSARAPAPRQVRSTGTQKRQLLARSQTKRTRKPRRTRRAPTNVCKSNKSFAPPMPRWRNKQAEIDELREELERQPVAP